MNKTAYNRLRKIYLRVARSYRTDHSTGPADRKGVRKAQNQLVKLRAQRSMLVD